ncbi:phosphate transport system permease protein PstA [Vibrio sp. JCM 19053]|nr:phosphate transport system permease protein PstA [Vibrio sp. JCM 19053]
MDRAKLKKARQFKDNVFNAFVWISAALTVGFFCSGLSGTSYQTVYNT